MKTVIGWHDHWKTKFSLKNQVHANLLYMEIRDRLTKYKIILIWLLFGGDASWSPYTFPLCPKNKYKAITGSLKST
jgi:hypothetical protein